MPRPKLDHEREPQILKALETCVIRQGLAKTSLKDVAEEAGLPRPLVRHFVGNRDEMISKLFDGMIDRAAQQLESVIDSDQTLSLTNCMDLLFEGLFADETSNALVIELWYLAERDAAIKSKVAALYLQVCDLVVEALHSEGLGETVDERRDVAFALVSLSYGDASFREIGLRAPSKSVIQTHAQAILSTLSKPNPKNRKAKS
ncbi:MAG: TetR/AcrR family transcriptional regulator [Pseudomonadota bacterium]